MVCSSYSVYIGSESLAPPNSGGGTGGAGGLGDSGGGGGSGEPFTSVQEVLTQTLGLSSAQENFLWLNYALADQMLNYMGMSDGVFTLTERKINLIQHLNLLMSNSAYLNYSLSIHNFQYPGWGWSTLWFNQIVIEGTEPVLYSNIQNLKLLPEQSYYLLNNPSIRSQIHQYFAANNNSISKILLKSSIDIALKGQPFQLPNIAVDYSANNNVNRIVVNLLENDCLEQVFTKITSQVYANSLSDMIRQFDANENVTIIMREDATMSSDTYGECEGFLDNQGNLKYYLIKLNPNLLSGASEELIADVFFHEFIHGYLKEHLNDYDFENISQHTQMLANYLDKMAAALVNVFGTNTIDAYCVAFTGLLLYNDTDPKIKQVLSSQVKTLVRTKMVQKFSNPIFQTDDAILQRAKEYDKNGTKGNRTGHCQ